MEEIGEYCRENELILNLKRVKSYSYIQTIQLDTGI